MTGPGRPPIGPVREVRIPDELWDQIKAEAERCGWSHAELVRCILFDHFDNPA